MKIASVVGIVILCTIVMFISIVLCILLTYKSIFLTVDYKDIELTFPIDIVYTWVDGNDINWRRLKNKHTTKPFSHGQLDLRWPSKRKKDELYYSLRSLYKFFPHFRNVWIVTQRPQIPSYIGEFDDRIHVIHHDQIFNMQTMQPTFNSHAIEANIHNINGLSERFIYMNDDIFFGKYCKPSHFFDQFGRPVFRGHLWPWWIFSIFHDFSYVWYRLKRCVEKRTGRKTKIDIQDHCPIPLTKTICRTSIKNYQREIIDTVKHRFRDRSDVPPIGLALYDGAINKQVIQFKIDPLKRKTIHFPIRTFPDAHVFCLNAFTNDKTFNVLKKKLS